MIKDRLYNEKRSKAAKESAQFTLYNVLLSVLKLIAPIMPHVSEEIYNLYFIRHEKFESIHLSDWPRHDKRNQKHEEIGDEFVKIMEEVRKFKSDKNMSLNKEFDKLTVTTKADLRDVLEDLKATARVKEIEIKQGEFKAEIIAQ